ncbi:hypothetical protein Pyn_25374 [Prunus yedoensis var. nudiflora]|uniref:AIPP2-like SPOC-like domain-containing protein n=1 Tax=Prunus yedoensis var. nudiflora TaxID=2094558 RepID=A0A314URG4_PRUYE|nr:hypothetical protein Pyn_25374 [Prunus yedoensis var. nudiflora]
MPRGSRLKDAIHAALLRKPEIYRKKRVFDPSDELSTSNVDLSHEGSEGSHDGQTVLGTSTSDSYKNTTVNNLKQHTVPPIDSVFPSKVTDSVSVVPSLGKSTVKDLHSHASVAMYVLAKTQPYQNMNTSGSRGEFRSAERWKLFGFMWWSSSSFVNLCIAKVQVPLSEVPRLSVWPSHFHQSGAKEDNIALYFFAKDLESYERDYKILLDAMIKNDLALKGNFDGVELLIFPSNQLPERSQPSAANSLLHMGPTVSKDHVSKDTYPEEVRSGSKVNLVVQDSRLDSNTTNNAGLSEGVPCTTPLQQEICLRGSRLGTEIKSSIPITGSNSSNKGEKRQVHWVTSGDRVGAESLKIRPISNQEVAIAGSVGEETIPDRKKRVGLAGGVEEVILDGVNIERVECKQDKELKGDYGYKEIGAALVETCQQESTLFSPVKENILI